MKPYVKVWNSDTFCWEYWTMNTRGLLFVGLRDSVVYLAAEGCFDQACSHYEEGKR